MRPAQHHPTSGATTITPALQRGFSEYLETTRDQPVYVILGVQGSGTNLLSRLLVRIFGFSVLLDRATVFNAAARLGSAPRRADVVREIDRFRSFLAPSRTDRMLGRRFLKRTEAFQGIFDELTPSAVRSGADFARLIYAYRAYSTGTTRMAIKSDDLWENIDRIDEIIPNRRVIMLTRDFRDNLLSICGKGFGPVEPLCAALYVKNQLARYVPEYRRAGAAGFHATFETLLNSTRSFVEDFARHFDLEPAVDVDATIPMLRFRPNKIGKWQRLSAQELAWCEGILRDELAEFGYAAASSSPAVPGRRVLFAARARDAVRRIPQKAAQVAERIRKRG